MLKEALIDKESMLVVRSNGKIVNLVREALSDCSGVFQTSTSDDAMAIAEKQLYTDNEENELHVLQSQFRPGLPFLEQWVLLLLTAPKRCLGLRRNRPSFMSAFTIMRIL